jgi:hypothetical protein
VEDDFIVYTSTSALECKIQTVYCQVCVNTRGRIGPDLGNYGILNWNNRIGFTHELFNTYTSQFTSSETPFFAFYQTIVNAYLEDNSPIDFCRLQTFQHAWFAFIRLQELDSSMQCSTCGPNPTVVIADGIAVSFPSHHVESLQPPTIPAKQKAYMRLKKMPISTSFPGSIKLRTSIYKALGESNCTERVDKLNIGIEELRKSPVIIHRSGIADI